MSLAGTLGENSLPTFNIPICLSLEAVLRSIPPTLKR